MTELQLLIIVVLIFGTAFTYWAWAISNTLMDILRVLKEQLALIRATAENARLVSK